MKKITITTDDYAEACAKAMHKLTESMEEVNASKSVFAEAMLEFIAFQNAIFNELFKEEERKYA